MKKLVALDPAYPGNTYNISGGSSPGIGRRNVNRFSDVAENSLAFVVSDEYGIDAGAAAGDNEKAATAGDSFIVRFENYKGKDDQNTAYHGGVIDVYKNLIWQWTSASVTSDQFDNIGNKSLTIGTKQHEGVITAKWENGAWVLPGTYFIPGTKNIYFR